MNSPSIVEWFGLGAGHSCGYCKGKTGSLSHGMWAHSITPGQYQGLIDRGWRRSGNYIYKPLMEETCCPQYTIKLDVSQFKPGKGHKKVAKKFRAYIIDGKGGDQLGKGEASEKYQRVMEEEEKKKGGAMRDDDESEEDSSEDEEESEMKKAETKTKMEKGENKANVDEVDQAVAGSSSSSDDVVMKGNRVEAKAKKPPKESLGADPSKPRCKKAKDIRKEKARLKGKMITDSPKQQQEGKTLAELVSTEFPSHAKHTFEIRTLGAQTSDPAFANTFDESYQVYLKYQVAIHGDKPGKTSKRQFTRFLCDSSMRQSGAFGAFHQQYVIDGRIACVGVIDVLSECTSSVYLYYDPDFAFLSPGVLSSLFEIHFTQSLLAKGVHNYYMGFYIHTCPKMRYKAQYAPSRLLCPITYKWSPVEVASPRLDEAKYSRLHDEGEPAEPKEIAQASSFLSAGNGVKVLCNRTIMPIKVYMDMYPQEEQNEVQEFVVKVGQEVARTLTLYRDGD